MYRVNTEDNTIVSLKKRRFKDLKLFERPHLQEWIAETPDALGEKLLIIQKEFAGFDDTRDRLDLLALDKDGRLVVVENKIDDASRDVVWQALRYVSYCSTLTKKNILEIYQNFLQDDGESAEDKICQFLEVEDLDEKLLNEGNSQRFILVSGSFRKEVTATVLWLIGHGIQVQCIQVTAYRSDRNTFVNFSQIIPPPESSDYMIKMADKESEVSDVRQTQSRSGRLRLEFWSRLKKKCVERGISGFETIQTNSDSYWGRSAGISDCYYYFVFTQSNGGVRCTLQRKDKTDNKWLFDRLHAQKEEIETELDAELEWKRRDGDKGSTIQYLKPIDGFNQDNWPDMINWLCERYELWERVFAGRMEQLKLELRSR